MKNTKSKYVTKERVNTSDLDPSYYYSSREYPEWGNQLTVQDLLDKGQTVTDLYRTFNSEEDYDTYKSNNPEQLGEIVVTATKPKWAQLKEQLDNLYGSGNPVWGSQRTSLHQNLTPEFYQTWDSASNIGEHLNAVTGGLLNRLSPTQNVRLLYDAATGKNLFDYGSSWWGNTGLAPRSLAQNHPYVSAALNLIGDAGMGAGGYKFYKWGTTPKLVGSGAEAEVYSAPFWTHVKKYGLDPEYVKLKNQIPAVVKTKFKGYTSDGVPIHTQPKVIPIRGTGRLLRNYYQRLANNHFFPVGVSERVQDFINPVTQMAITDLDGNLGLTFKGIKAYDPAVLTTDEYFSVFKKGGKLNGKLVR